MVDLTAIAAAIIHAPALPNHHLAKIYTPASVEAPRATLFVIECYVDSHHLCTDTAALHTAVSEVAFLVQNRLSPYITFYRLLSVSRFVTEDTLWIPKYIFIFLILLHHQPRLMN